MVVKAKLCLLVLFTGVLVLFAEYPITSLQCFSSLTKPQERLICPAARNNYCVKEVSSLTKNLCGGTQYYGDVYVKKECQFKKCSDTCIEETYNFEFEGRTYTRSRYCCNTDFCNAGSRTSGVNIVLFMTLLAGLCSYLLFM